MWIPTFGGEKEVAWVVMSYPIGALLQQDFSTPVAINGLEEADPPIVVSAYPMVEKQITWKGQSNMNRNIEVDLGSYLEVLVVRVAYEKQNIIALVPQLYGRQPLVQVRMDNCEQHGLHYIFHKPRSYPTNILSMGASSCTLGKRWSKLILSLPSSSLFAMYPIGSSRN